MKNPSRFITISIVIISAGFSLAALGLIVIIGRIFVPLFFDLTDAQKEWLQQLAQYFYAGGVIVALIGLALLILSSLMYFVLVKLKSQSPQSSDKTEE